MNWTTATLLILGLVLAAGFGWYERSRPSARIVALVGAMAALAVVGRLAFAPIPNVKPTTDIVLFAGYALGGAPGFAVGALTALASNVFLSQGPWTPWQMVAWGGVGIAGAALARASRGRELGRVQLAIACGAAGLAFGAFMDVYQTSFTANPGLGSYGVVASTSLPYNLAHAIGNVVFCLAFGPALVRALRRYKRRFEVRWAAPAAATVLLALLLAAPAAASTSSRAVDYLEAAQNSDGGWGAGPGAGSTQLYTGWTALGLAAAGRNPGDVEKGGKSSLDFAKAGIRSLDDAGEIERTTLFVAASGADPRSFGGKNLVSALGAKRKRDGSIGGLVNLTSFGILALKAAGAGNTARPAAWLARQQNGDGGFGFGPKSGTSDADDTGAAIQALVAAGKRGSPAVRKAVKFFRKGQNADGGFSSLGSGTSNAQSTAWAVQGLLAAGVNPNGLKRGSRTPLEYLASLQAGDGSIRYSRTSAQTPVWVTGQALTALERKPFPIARLPRKSSAVTPTQRPTRARAKAEAAKPRFHHHGRKTSRRGRTRVVTSRVAAHTRSDPIHGEFTTEAERRNRPPLVAVLSIGAAAVLVAAGVRWRGRRRN